MERKLQLTINLEHISPSKKQRMPMDVFSPRILAINRPSAMRIHLTSLSMSFRRQGMQPTQIMPRKSKVLLGTIILQYMIKQKSSNFNCFEEKYYDDLHNQ